MKSICRAALGAVFAVSIAACEYQGDAARSIEEAVAKDILTPHVDPDVALTEKVRKALGIDDPVAAYGVEVAVDDGRVTLYGYVASTAARKRFEVLAAGVIGVKSIDNRLVVSEGT